MDDENELKKSVQEALENWGRRLLESITQIFRAMEAEGHLEGITAAEVQEMAGQQLGKSLERLEMAAGKSVEEITYGSFVDDLVDELDPPEPPHIQA